MISGLRINSLCVYRKFKGGKNIGNIRNNVFVIVFIEREKS